MILPCKNPHHFGNVLESFGVRSNTSNFILPPFAHFSTLYRTPSGAIISLMSDSTGELEDMFCPSVGLSPVIGDEVVAADRDIADGIGFCGGEVFPASERERFISGIDSAIGRDTIGEPLVVCGIERGAINRAIILGK